MKFVRHESNAERGSDRNPSPSCGKETDAGDHGSGRHRDIKVAAAQDEIKLSRAVEEAVVAGQKKD
jgi:hypothetical protein